MKHENLAQVGSSWRLGASVLALFITDQDGARNLMSVCRHLTGHRGLCPHRPGHLAREGSAASAGGSNGAVEAARPAEPVFERRAHRALIFGGVVLISPLAQAVGGGAVITGSLIVGERERKKKRQQRRGVVIYSSSTWWWWTRRGLVGGRSRFTR